MKSSGIGGQALIEGVMMKNKEQYAVAVRKPDGEIEVTTNEYKGIAGKSRIFGLPFIRGVFNFIDSMVLGMKTLTYSASFFEEEEEKVLTEAEQKKQDKKESVLMGFTVFLSIIIAVGVFMVLPLLLVNWLEKLGVSETWRSTAEGILRIVIFFVYIVLISRMNDIKRVFMYHGAEHKCINCIEHGLELNVENVRKSSKQHKRCGTSFILIVMIISVIMFILVGMFFKIDTLLMRILSRVLLIPVIAGISYEFLRLAGRSDNPVVNFLSKPGLAFQRLTTKEPDDSMIEVAIKSVEAVFDWKAYLKENFDYKEVEE
ncbi:MAG: DUF1385 domain-containing protein [Lachnospiraceae bacterium]|nr:DUF1385 domain-containing protein [Lachnospiraceae bacterium]